jgi:integrase
MGVYSRHGKRGVRWYVRYWRNGVEHRECAGATRAHAKELLALRRLERSNAEHPELPASRKALTVAALVNEHLDAAEALGYRSASVMRGQAAHVLAHRIAGLEASALGPREVERYILDRLAERPRPAHGTLNRETALLRGALSRAVRDGRLPAHPMRGVQPLREPPGRLRILSLDEETTILAKCHPRLRSFVVVCIYSGLRRGEALALRRRDVDLTANVLHVERSAPGGPAGTKSNDRRDVPLHPAARAALLPLLAHRRPDALLWQTRTGKPYRTAWRAFHGAALRAKVADVTLHSLRHTAASRMAAAGASLEDIALILGHRDLRTTRRYVHLLRSHLRGRVLAMAQPDQEPETGDGLGSALAP